MKCFAKIVNSSIQSTFFAKTFTLDISLGSDYVLDMSLFFYFFFHFESIKFKSSRSQLSFKKDAFKNFAILESLCNKGAGLLTLLACKFINKRFQHKCFPINIVKFLRTALFIEHLLQLLFKSMFETCQNFTIKYGKGFY